jgi:hypothetical protein
LIVLRRLKSEEKRKEEKNQNAMDGKFKIFQIDLAIKIGFIAR